MQPDVPSQLLSFATRALGAGHLAAAEIACRELLDRSPRDAAGLHLLGYIAAQAGMRDAALAYFKAALESEPDNARIRENLLAVQGMPSPALQRGERYLLIKDWGFGFWADMAHTIGSLLLAEITGRIPLVYWGPESRFSDKSQSDAFTHYFEPVSGVSLQQLAGMQNASFFPPRWHAGNLTQSGVSKWEGKGSRAGAVFFLNRPETIAVSDFNIGVVHVMPWIPIHHPLHGKSLEDIHRTLVDKYLRPRPDIAAACDEFYQAHLSGSPFVAVHLRGSDKALEDAHLVATNREVFAALDAVDPSWPIFLMTDDTHCLARMKNAYGRRIVATDCQRTDTDKGVHYLPTVDPVRAGREIMIDTYIALRADRFIGNGLSNVSAMIAVMKDWAPGSANLIGRSILRERNLHIYQIPTFAKGGS
jgi:tetratricopeptide (TPR) repeat protein